MRDVAHGDGHALPLAEGKAVLEVYPAAAVTRVTTPNARVELFRVPTYSLDDGRIVFEHNESTDGSRLVVTGDGNVSLYPTVLRTTNRRLPTVENTTAESLTTPAEAERSEAGEPEPVTLTGRLGRDPWFSMQDETPTAGFPLAVNEPGKTTWHQVVVFEEAAEQLHDDRQIKKGRLVEVTGREIVSEEPTAAGGTRKTRKIHASTITRLKATKSDQPSGLVTPT
ncbi:MAG: single-stranded DNA-binding protein [Pseudonocardiales bacterium]